MPMKSVIASLTIALILTGCVPMTTPVTETETEGTLCRVWGESLSTRSRSDTEQTRDEIGEGYADFAAACPDFTHLIP